jgi:hypothetical protein
VKRSLLKVLMVMALGVVICLPGVAAALTLDFSLPDKTNLNTATPDYNIFTWNGWTVANGSVSAGNVATITINSGTFTFDAADFALNNGTSNLTITGYASGTPVVTWSFGEDFKVFEGISLTQLAFSSDSGFTMDNFVDALIPLPPSALLLGTGLLGLVGLGWRRRKTS